MKYFLGAVAIVNTAATTWTLLYYPQLYEWSWLMLDAAIIFLAGLSWLTPKES
ncbi:hypothetical protein ACU8NH_09360 [Rhizobium leguminosarum]